MMKVGIGRVERDGDQPRVKVAEGSYFLYNPEKLGVDDLVVVRYEPEDQFAWVVPLSEVTSLLVAADRFRDAAMPVWAPPAQMRLS
jgi:hypothetical protein